jgi:tetratricopeptide (TPR) repeat protein
VSESDLDLGMAALQAGRWEEGIGHLGTVLQRQPHFAEAWSNLGFALRASGRRAEARDALERALHLKPQLADAWNLLGLVDQETGRHEEARQAFERALALRPDFVAAMMNHANSEQALGRHDAALDGYARALAIAPQNAAVRYNLAHLHEKAIGDYAMARDGYREAIRLDPQLADAHLNLANMLFALGDFAQGWREFAWRPQRRAYEAALAHAGRHYEVPQALPDPVRLRGEQGLGDILFFLRFAALAKKGARLEFNGDRRLHPLLERTGLFDALIEESGLPPPQVRELLVADLPVVVDPAGTAFPPALRLTPHSAARATLEKRLAGAGPATVDRAHVARRRAQRGDVRPALQGSGAGRARRCVARHPCYLDLRAARAAGGRARVTRRGAGRAGPRFLRRERRPRGRARDPRSRGRLCRRQQHEHAPSRGAGARGRACSSRSRRSGAGDCRARRPGFRE